MSETVRYGWLATIAFVICAAVLFKVAVRRDAISALVAFRRGGAIDRRRLLLSIAGVCLAFAAWTLAAELRPTGFNRIPSPEATARAAGALLRNGELISASWASAQRVFVGFCMAMVLGTMVGWIVGTFVVARRVIQPVNSFLRYIPPTAFVTLLIIYFGVGESYKYAVVFVGLFFFVVQMVVDAVDDVDKQYVELALTSGFRQITVLRYVIVPATSPRIIDIGRINLSAAWTLIVVAEVVGSDNGLGHLLSVSQRFNRIENLYAGIAAFGCIGFVSDFALYVASKLAFPWARQ